MIRANSGGVEIGEDGHGLGVLSFFLSFLISFALGGLVRSGSGSGSGYGRVRGYGYGYGKSHGVNL